MTRRELLQLAATLPLMVFIDPYPRQALAASTRSPQHARWDRVLILIELNGGNDGLNTLVPYGDARYYHMRPRLAIARERVLQLNEQIGLHYALAPLMPLWQQQELAWVQGVGYAEPNRSHFRSIEVWETGSDSRQIMDVGWIARLFANNPPPSTLAADGIVLGRRDAGPLSGKTIRTIALEDPQQFLVQASRVSSPTRASSNPALAHILQVQRELTHAAADFAQRLEQSPSLQASFPASPIGRQLQTAAQLLAAKIPVAVIKVSIGSFDTHANQLGHHERLLRELAEAIVAFRQAVREAGHWDRVLMMTYSEFGRRAGENASAGTDHGTAAPHFFLGGAVKGGLYGAAPSLMDLPEGDLRYHIDYRSLYRTIITNWWDLPGAMSGLSDHHVIDCLA
ncbi:MAG: DUF1501 domain-containing protein [Nitrospira sp.]|nr:DUF1501 domain-containing protein [Nitrospira sp.]MDH4304810.1 DUF1501 domain-containing protein [Nitrospira sp.]MDH5194896.1 DUF1501 domain-containing protein [Nitrospira sp.]